jgi:uncharacterized phage protein (TIGR02218 family)
MTKARVDQGGAYALAMVEPAVRIAQAGAYALTAITANVPVAQGGMYALASDVPCGTQWAQAWTIMRTDGTVFRFTSLDRDLSWNGATYRSCDSLDPSASEAVSEVDAAGSMDLSGALSATGIDRWDLYAGIFDGAKVEVWLVPWSGRGSARRLLRGSFGAVSLGETGFSVELLGDGAKLMQTPLVRPITPDCRWLFGDQFCGKNLGPLTVTGTVDTGDGLRSFTDATRVEAAGYFSRGRVTFTSGANVGVSAEIKDHDAGGVFTLWPRVPFAIADGDAYSMTPGCTNLKDSANGTNGCTAWAQLVRYGGFDKVPGGDKRGKAAVQKPAG